MSAYYFHDGQNELGPFTIELLKKQKLTRNTPVRQRDADNWQPAEKLEALKDLVAPKKIRRPKDIIPVVQERFSDIKQKHPTVLYGGLLGIALLLALSIISTHKSAAKEFPAAVATVQEPVEKRTETEPITDIPTPKTEVPIVKEKEVKKEDGEKATRLRWNKLITATNSNYGIGLLGGIKDLNVIITNRTGYLIDELEAKVTYIKANGGIWKTKVVTIYDIPAHDNKEESLPDVGRGKKVKVSIQKVISKKMKFSYTEGQKIKDLTDSYLIQ